MSVVLSHQEVIDLTGKEKPTYQGKQLDHLKIPYKTRTDGSLVVLRSHVELMLGGGVTLSGDTKTLPQLRFG